MLERHLFAADFSPDATWRLCAWCHERGADEFTLDVIGKQPPGAAVYATLEAPLRPFARGSAVRERLSAQAGQPFRREADLWSVSGESLVVLPKLFPLGPFQYNFSQEAWCEDLTLYREGELMLGIVSHEDWGVLRLTDLEAAQVAAAGFPVRVPRAV